MYVPKQREQGTTLIIEKLQDSWSDTAITRAYKYTENLLLPEPLSEERKAWDAKRYDPGFKAYLYRDKISEETIVINEDIAFLNHALATIEGYIDSNGYAFWKVYSDKIDIPYTGFNKIGAQRENDELPFSHIHSIHLAKTLFPKLYLLI